jgi:hypothetical protein
MTKYIVKKGSRRSKPRISKWCVKANGLQVTFKMGESFSQLYKSEDRSTHKIIGLSDLLGRNSIRLGFRRALTNAFTNQFVPVAYLHIDGKIFYPKIDGVTLETGKIYQAFFYINARTGCYDINLCKVNEWGTILQSADYQTLVKIDSSCKRLQGIYVEVGSKASLWDLDMEVEYVLT